MMGFTIHTAIVVVQCNQKTWNNNILYTVLIKKYENQCVVISIRSWLPLCCVHLLLCIMLCISVYIGCNKIIRFKITNNLSNSALFFKYWFEYTDMHNMYCCTYIHMLIVIYNCYLIAIYHSLIEYRYLPYICTCACAYQPNNVKMVSNYILYNILLNDIKYCLELLYIIPIHMNTLYNVYILPDTQTHKCVNCNLNYLYLYNDKKLQQTHVHIYRQAILIYIICIVVVLVSRNSHTKETVTIITKCKNDVNVYEYDVWVMHLIVGLTILYHIISYYLKHVPYMPIISLKRMYRSTCTQYKVFSYLINIHFSYINVDKLLYAPNVNINASTCCWLLTTCKPTVTCKYYCIIQFIIISCHTCHIQRMEIPLLPILNHMVNIMTLFIYYEPIKCRPIVDIDNSTYICLMIINIVSILISNYRYNIVEAIFNLCHIMHSIVYWESKFIGLIIISIHIILGGEDGMGLICGTWGHMYSFFVVKLFIFMSLFRFADEKIYLYLTSGVGTCVNTGWDYRKLLISLLDSFAYSAVCIYPNVHYIVTEYYYNIITYVHQCLVKISDIRPSYTCRWCSAPYILAYNLIKLVYVHAIIMIIVVCTMCSTHIGSERTLIVIIIKLNINDALTVFNITYIAIVIKSWLYYDLLIIHNCMNMRGSLFIDLYILLVRIWIGIYNMILCPGTIIRHGGEITSVLIWNYHINGIHHINLVYNYLVFREIITKGTCPIATYYAILSIQSIYYICLFIRTYCEGRAVNGKGVIWGFDRKLVVI